MNRRHWNMACLGTALPLLGGGITACGTASPQPRWYRLPSEPPAGEPPARPVSSAVWELASTVKIPELLERDTLLVEEGAAGVRLLYGHRWAEPLRDALPRVLRHDLGLWLPGLWPTPAPADVLLAGRMQVELLALSGSLGLRQVRVAARWVITPSVGARSAPAARAVQAEETVPWTDASAESLVVAQRLAMWRLARRIAASVTPDALG